MFCTSIGLHARAAAEYCTGHVADLLHSTPADLLDPFHQVLLQQLLHRPLTVR
jgi:hypothetical protein